MDKVASGSYFVSMRVVGIKVLKNKLSEYVKLASRGETILVTDRDKVVAQLVPPAVTRHPWESDPRVASLIRRGILTPPQDISGEPPPRKPIMTFEEGMKLLDEVRADRDDLR